MTPRRAWQAGLTALWMGCLLACQTSAQKRLIKVAASDVPHAQILLAVAPQLAAQHIKLRIVPVSDYIVPNMQLMHGDIDANYFQTAAYMAFFNHQHGDVLRSIADVHFEPFGIYVRGDKGRLDDGATVALPADVSNRQRALQLLAGAGMLTLASLQAPAQVLKNPHHLRLIEAEAAMMPRMLHDVAAAGINANHALAAGLNPQQGAWLLERPSAAQSNVLAVCRAQTQNQDLQALAQALVSQAARSFIQSHYGGAVIPLPPD